MVAIYPIDRIAHEMLSSQLSELLMGMSNSFDISTRKIKK